MNYIENIDATTFSLNGVVYQKNFMSRVLGSENLTIINTYDSKNVLLKPTSYENITLNGNTYNDAVTLHNNLIGVLFTRVSLVSEGTVINQDNGIKPYYISPEPTPQTENFFIDVIVADNINNRVEQIPQSSKLIYIYTLFQYGGQSFRKIWILDNSNRAYGQGTQPIGAGNLVEFNTQALQQNSVVDLGDIGALVGNETYEEHLRDYINAQDPFIGLINSGTIRADFGGDVREFNFSNVTGDYGLNVNQTDVTDFQLYGESNNEEDAGTIVTNTSQLVNDGEDGTSRFIEEDELGTIAYEDSNQYIKQQEREIPNGIATLDGAGKLKTDQIPDLAITDVVTPTETTIEAFVTNNANYTYQQGDVIVIDDGSGDVTHNMYKGGDKSLVTSYSEINATEFAISQINGLQDELDDKLDKGNTLRLTDKPTLVRQSISYTGSGISITHLSKDVIVYGVGTDTDTQITFQSDKPTSTTGKITYCFTYTDSFIGRYVDIEFSVYLNDISKARITNDVDGIFENIDIQLIKHTNNWYIRFLAINSTTFNFPKILLKKVYTSRITTNILENWTAFTNLDTTGMTVNTLVKEFYEDEFIKKNGETSQNVAGTLSADKHKTNGGNGTNLIDDNGDLVPKKLSSFEDDIGATLGVANLILGGVGSTINTPTLLASKFSFDEADVNFFQVYEGDVYAHIINEDYNIVNQAFKDNITITKIVEKDGNLKSNGGEGLKGAINLKLFDAIGCERIEVSSFADCVNLSPEKIIIPNANFLGLKCFQNIKPDGKLLKLNAVKNLTNAATECFIDNTIDVEMLNLVECNQAFVRFKNGTANLPNLTKLGVDFDTQDGALNGTDSTSTFIVDYSLRVVNNGERDATIVFAEDTLGAKVIYANVPNIATVTTDTLTELDLTNPNGNFCNHSSANSTETYTILNSIAGNKTEVLVNAVNEPTITGATKLSSSDSFISNTDIYMIVEVKPNRVEYYFKQI